VATHRLGIIMHGITGRMGLNTAPRALDRGDPARGRRLALPNGDRVMPDTILVGRNPERVAADRA